jgi:hypothetical protein
LEFVDWFSFYIFQNVLAKLKENQWDYAGEKQFFKFQIG